MESSSADSYQFTSLMGAKCLYLNSWCSLWLEPANFWGSVGILFWLPGLRADLWLRCLSQWRSGPGELVMPPLSPCRHPSEILCRCQRLLRIFPLFSSSRTKSVLQVSQNFKSHYQYQSSVACCHNSHNLLLVLSNQMSWVAIYFFGLVGCV